MTFCISTQVGCAMALRVLPDRQDGAGPQSDGRRDRRPGPRARRSALDLRDKAFNIVLMGMGEPLHNYDETMKALRILADEHGFALPPRRVTLSTVGLLPALERLAREPLHAQSRRSRFTRRPMRSAAISCRSTRSTASRKSSTRASVFRCASAAGSRSSTCCWRASTTRPEDARRLAKAAGRREVEGQSDSAERRGRAFRSSGRRTTPSIAFAKILADRGVTVSVRKSRGRDIRAACGQLIVEGERKSPAQQLAVML